MPLITVDNLTKYYGTDLILDHVAFAVDHRERLGLIGANGTGKTTLCRILMGQESYEEDSQIHSARGMTTGYLSQDVQFSGATTPWEVVMQVFAGQRELEVLIQEAEERMAEDLPPAEMEAALEEHSRLLAEYEAGGGYSYEREAAKVLAGLGVPERDFHRDLMSFSGGEQRRVALAQLLLTRPDRLLLDEPTNHLDITGTEWLEGYLRDYPGAVVAISHDRRFLDAVAQRILELEAQTLTEYRGGYSDYARQKEERLLTHERTYERQQEEYKAQMAFIRWALATQQEKKVKAAKSRMKLLEKKDWLDPPAGQRRQMSLRFKPRIRGGDEIIEFRGLGMRFGEKQLFSGVDLHVRRGQRVGIVGPNGCGKTTLLRIAMGLEQPAEGTSRVGRSVEVGYHRQDEFGLTPENRVYDEFRTVVPDAEEQEIRNLLARFLFVDDEILKRVGDLSGGEQSRLSLAKLMMTQPTLLVLDEPTNHLDIDSRSALEGALREYEGTVLVVSHDRQFLDNVVHRVMVFEGRKATLHEGNWSAYVAKRRELKEALEAADVQRMAEQRRARQDRDRKELVERRKREALEGKPEKLPPVVQLEARAHHLETQMAKIMDILGRPETYASPLRVEVLNAERGKLAAELESVYEMWERAEAGG